MSVLGTNGPRLLAEKCSTCIFRPGNKMHLREGRLKQMSQKAINDGGYITCHHTLEYGGYPEADEPICRGFFDSFGHLSNVIRIWGRIGAFDEVADPATVGAS